VLFWKIFFWVFSMISLFSFINVLINPNPEGLLILIILPELIAIYGYAYRKRFFTSFIWKIYFFLDSIYILWGIYTTLAVTFNLVAPDFLIPLIAVVAGVFLLFIVPIHIAIYLYAFNFMNENITLEASEILDK
jgi:hypothetical protein